MRLVEIATETSSLQTALEHLAGFSQNYGNGFIAAASELYEILIRPLGLRYGSTLVFVPDGFLHAVPYGPLFDSRAKKYLIEDHPVVVAPSAALFIECSRRARRIAGNHLRVLAVSDPAFDSGLFPRLGHLAGGEAETLATIFQNTRIIAGRYATKAAFLRAADEFDLIHFGGHALENPEFPLLSQLILAPASDGRDRGVLYFRELLGRRFRRSQIVVLAACGTAKGEVSSGEGSLSLARPFLAGGVPAVVASLWAVDDQATTQFFARFYWYLWEVGEASIALRKAQLDLLAEERGRSAGQGVWAAFELIGGFPREVP